MGFARPRSCGKHFSFITRAGTLGELPVPLSAPVSQEEKKRRIRHE